MTESYDDRQIKKQIYPCQACGTPYYMTAPGLCVPCADKAAKAGR